MSLVQSTLLSAPILFFALGGAAALARSDLTIPDQIAKAMSLYLMVAIGFKGGHEVALSGLGTHLAVAAGLGLLFSVTIPLWAFALLRRFGKLDGINAAAAAAHYGSISVVTFVTALELFKTSGVPVSGSMVAVMALMETPAIIVALLLARRYLDQRQERATQGEMLREALFNGSVVLLLGAFAIGIITGDKGFAVMSPLIDKPFKAVLCFFLLDMGLVAVRRLTETRALSWRMVACALVLPPVNGALGVALAWAAGLPLGDATILGVLAASASYIAAPAAMRLTLPQANPGIYLTLSLGVTFPFNIIIGIPLYLGVAHALYGA